MKKEETILSCGCRWRTKKIYLTLPPVIYYFSPCEHHLEKYQDEFIALMGKLMRDCENFQRIKFGEDNL